MVIVGSSGAWADDVPNPVYFNDFSSTTGLTVVGNGAFEDDADAKFGKIFHNDPTLTKAIRTNYLKLPSDVLSHSATSKQMTIGFWVNKKNATDYFFSPIFTAYNESNGTKSHAFDEGNTNGWLPFLYVEARGLLQWNANGWCDFTDEQNDAKTNTQSTTWTDDGNWHYFAITFTSTSAKVYVDGNVLNAWTIADNGLDGLFTQTELNYICLGGNQAFGWDDPDPAFAFDDFAVYDTALTAEQIKAVMAKKTSDESETPGDEVDHGSAGQEIVNADINFDGVSVNNKTITGTVGSMAWTQEWTMAPYIEDNILRFGNFNGGKVDLLNGEVEFLDEVTISFDLAFGKLNNKYVGFNFVDANGNTFVEQHFRPYNGDFDGKNPLNLSWDNMYRGSNTVIQDRCVSFNIKLDYRARKIITSTKCYMEGPAKPDKLKEATYEVPLSQNNLIKSFVLTGNINNTGRYSTLDNLKIVTKKGDYSIPSYLYTLKAKADDIDLGTIASDYYFENAECTVSGLPKAIEKDGKYYVLEQGQKGVSGYSYTFTKASEEETLYVSYKLDDTIVFFAEAENLSNAVGIATGDYSAGKSAAVNGGKTAMLATFSPGEYTATAHLVERGDRGIFFRDGGNNDNNANAIANCSVDKNSAAGVYSVNFTLTESKDVVLSGYTNSEGKLNQSATLDYVYITRNANLVLPGYYGKLADLTGNVDENYNITVEDDKLTIKSLKTGFGFQKVKLLASKLGTLIPDAGSVSNNGLWTGDAQELVINLGGTTLNAIVINDGELPEVSSVSNIAAFKATTEQSAISLNNAEVCAIVDEGTIIEDDGAGILLQGIVIPGAKAGSKLSGSITGVYDGTQVALVSGSLTDCTSLKVGGQSSCSAKEMTIAEALTTDNSFRIAKLKALTISGTTVTDESGNVLKIGNKLFADLDAQLDGQINAIAMTGILYFNGTENVLMPRSANDLELGTVKMAFTDGEEFAPGDELSSNSGVVMTFGGVQTEGNMYKFQTLTTPVNGYTTATDGISEGTSYQFDALRDGTLTVTVALEKGKNLTVTCEDEELSLKEGDYEFDGTVITIPVEAGKTYNVFSADSNLGLIGFEYQVSNPSDEALAKNISVFRKMVAGSEAKLMLEDAQVTYIKGDNVFVEDASGAIDFFETQMQFYVGQKLNGYIIGENNKQANMPVLLRTEATPNSKFTTEKGTAQSKIATISEVKNEDGLARFVTLNNLQLAKDKRGFKILIDETGDTIYIEDHFNVFYDLTKKVKSIEGIIGTNVEETIYIWPTSKESVVAGVEPATLETGKYYLKNVGSGLFWGAGNDWGTRGSLVKHAEYVTLIAQGNGIYQMESQVSNGGTAYYFEGDYMDNANPMNLSINKTKTEGIYTIADPNENLFGYDGTSTVLGKNVADGENAQWQIISEDEMKATLNAAAEDNGVDATFLILDPNFGRNNRNVSAWTMANEGVAYNLSGGNNINNCAESYMSTFVLSQEVSVPNGKYVLNAQAAVTFHDDRVIKDYDGNGYPQITANGKVSDFKEMETDDRLSNMGRLSEQFTAGKYAVEPITVYVTDGKLTIGAKSDRADIWAIWDNFELTYYGPADDPDATYFKLDFTTATYATNPTIELDLSAKVGRAYETGNARQQDIYVATAPAEIAGKLAFQAVSNGVSGTKGWWIRSDKGGLWTWNANRSAAVLNMKAGAKVVFTCTQDAANVMTLTNGDGEPDGPFTYVKSEDGKQYICTMTEDGNIGFCGAKSVGYIASIEIFTDGIITGIDNVQTTSRVFEDGVVYNLKGQKVGDSLQGLKKGLYIINERKVVVK